MSADDRAVGEPERLHPLFLLTGLGGAIRGMAGGYAFIAYLAIRGQLATALFGAVALFVLLALALVLYWRKFEYRVGDREIRIDSGIFSRTHRSIPFDRVQDVDISQGPVARLLGLAKVKFETGGSSGRDEGVLQAITLERAQQLRELIRSRRAAGAPVATADEGADLPPIYAMDVPRLLLAGVFNFSLAVFAGLFGLTQTVGDVIGFDPFSRTFWNRVLSQSAPIQAFVLANRVFTALAGLLSLVVIGLATGIVRTALRDYGFRLDLTHGGVRRRRGLLNRTDVTLPIARAQAAIIATGPMRESLGWRELRLQSLARDEGGSGDHVLAPLASAAETAAVIEAIGWRPVPESIAWRRVSAAYVVALAVALAPVLVAGVAQIPFFPLIGALLAVLALASLALRWLAWRRTGYALDGDRLLVRTGWWRRRTLILPMARIQSVDLAQSFVSRWFGVASLVFGIAGGSAVQINSIPAIPAETARALRRELLSSAA
ncbi:MAG: PH domain-containing protein [Alphaproteobacteria bacterium]